MNYTFPLNSLNNQDKDRYLSDVNDVVLMPLASISNPHFKKFLPVWMLLWFRLLIVAILRLIPKIRTLCKLWILIAFIWVDLADISTKAFIINDFRSPVFE